jgi:hypothetical protein
VCSSAEEVGGLCWFELDEEWSRLGQPFMVGLGQGPGGVSAEIDSVVRARKGANRKQLQMAINFDGKKISVGV